MAISDSQNYLHSKRLVNELIAKSNITTSDLVLEIGPGKGIITEELVKCSKKVIAVELDRNLYLGLREKFSNTENLQLVNRDFLQTQLPAEEYKVFSNIPFNLTAEIIIKLLGASNPPNDMFIIMQYEAALKYSGEPYYAESMRSLMYKPYFDIQMIHEFNPKDFYPIPNVSIVFVHFHKKEFSDITNATAMDYWDFLSYIFSAQGKFFKEKTKKIFSYEQQKRLKKALEIGEEDHISTWTYPQWLGLFDCYNILVSKEKKLLVEGSYANLSLQQSKLKKEHRDRNHGKGRNSKSHKKI